MLDRLINKHVSENLQWYFDKYLKDHYNRQRETLIEVSKQHETQQKLYPVIDYILQTYIGPEAQYPPATVDIWHKYYNKLGSGGRHVFDQLLFIYLKLDISNYLAIRERESTTGRQTRVKDKAELSYLQTTLDKLVKIPKAFDFPSSIIKLSTGLWALDNDQMSLMLTCLSDPSIDLNNYFDSPRDLIQLIVGTLHCNGNSRMALYMSKIHRHESSDDEYDQLYAYLLIYSGQLVEALKYGRIFIDQDNYQEILQRFFELCSRLGVTKALNCLNLSVEEEEAWNNHLASLESRPVTPSLNSDIHYSTRQLNLATPINPSFKLNSNHNQSSRKSTCKRTPRNRTVQALNKASPLASDSPARNTRSAKKKVGTSNNNVSARWGA